MLRFICIGVLILNSLWAAALGGAATGGAAAGGAAIGGGGAAAGALIAQTEEGWRWRNNLVVQLGGREIDLREEHQRLADIGVAAHHKLIANDKKKNVLTFSFTAAVQTPEGLREIHIHPKHAIGGAPRTVLFVSGEGDCLDSLPGYYMLTGHSSIPGNTDFKNRLRSLVHSRFTTTEEHTEDCLVHNKCILYSSENSLLISIDSWPGNHYLHTEQFLVKFLSDQRISILGQILASLSGLPAGTVIKALILNVHTRLDMCERCAPSLYREMVDANPDYFSQYIKEQLQQRNPTIGDVREMPIFKIVVSSLVPYQDGTRRKKSGHDNHLDDLLTLDDSPAPYMQVPITIQPHLEPTYAPLE